ncbi:MAG: hypothetical protein AAF557_19610 [Pseudomonadota bacterium]
MRVLIPGLFALILAAPTPAAAGINPAQVANCLGKNWAQPDRCLPVVFEPCAQVPKSEQSACIRQITFEWLRLSEFRTQKLLQDNPISPDAVSHKPLTNEMQIDVPGCEVSSYRQGVIDTRDLELSSRLCTLLAVARTWHVVEANPEGAIRVFRTFITNRERLKACVRKSAPAAKQNNCIGLIAERCARQFSRRLCNDKEAILWEAILTDSFAKLGPDTANALLSAQSISSVDVDTCQRNLDFCALALRDQNANRAILLFLATNP